MTARDRLLNGLVRLYPPRWRRRYGNELRELLSDRGLTLDATADLLRGAAIEWWRAAARPSGGVLMVVGPAWRHPTAWGVAGALIAAPTLLFVVASLIAFQMNVPLVAAWMDSVTAGLSTARLADVGLVVAPAVALLAAAMPLVRLERTGEQPGEVTFTIRTIRLNIVVAAAATALMLGVVAYGATDWILEAAR